jgi:peptidoglycan/LPS O-acetylase OafA/YrhL
MLRHLGRYSYAIYLFHWPLWLVVGPYVPQPTLGGSRWPAQLLALAVMIGLSLVGGWASWMLIERHILALKRFVPYAAAVPVGVRPPSSAWRTTAEAGASGR